jgi:hypothetical protein
MRVTIKGALIRNITKRTKIMSKRSRARTILILILRKNIRRPRI